MKSSVLPAYRKNVLARSVALALVLPFTVTAFAQSSDEDSDETSSEDGKTFDTVNIVGSRIKRASFEGPAPVTVITREDFEREGFATVADALQTLSQNTTSSFTGDQAVTGFSPNAQVVNLRNLGPGYTLVLINGRRPAQYPQPYNRDNNVVNIRAIPASIIERVEILSGGASAIYGSDAVAGVVNIVLRSNYDGHLIRGTIGSTHEGGGDSYGLEFTGGTTGDRWSATYALQYGNQDPVFASEREFLSDTREGPLGVGFTNPALSLISIRLSNPVAGSAVNQNAYFPGQAVCDRFGYTTVTTAQRGQYCGSFTQPASRSISNKQEYYSGYGHFTFDLSDSVQAFGSLSFYDQSASSSSGTEFWGTANDPFNRTSGNAATSAYWDPQVGALIQLQRVFNPFELGGETAATTLYDEQTYDFSFGFSGLIGDRFDWEASFAHGKYEYKADRPRLLAQAVHDYFLGPQLGFQGIYPVYNLNRDRWHAPITPDIYRSFATRVINTAESESTTANFTLSGDLFEMPAGPVGFAGVLEFNRQTTDLMSDPRTNQTRPRDNQTIYNLTSSGETHGERDRYAVGAEFRVPLLSTLTLNAAARYDQYDDITAVDAATTYNLGLEYRPVDALLLRASYSTSFRAPDMQLVFAEGAASFSGIFDHYACRSGIGLGQTTGPRRLADCGTVDPTRYSTQTLVAGNPLLKEEEGTSFTAGLVWDITDGMSLSVDYYRIKLEDAAAQLASTTILENEANCRLGTYDNGNPFPFALDSAYCQNILSLITRQSAPGTALDGQVQRINSAYINQAYNEVSGIDTTYRYNWDTESFGAFGIDLSYTVTLTNKYKQTEDDELIDYRNSIDFDYSQRSRARGSLNWRIGDWSTTIFGTRYGSNGSNLRIDGQHATAPLVYQRRLPPYMLYNLQVAKKFGENVLAQFTIINVLDNTHRKDNSFTAYPFYQTFIGADPLGRRFQLAVSYKF